MNNPDKPLINALKHMLKPLVRFLIQKNVPLRGLVEILKSVYVEEAESRLLIDSGKATDSQISVMTGVHRKDVKKLRTQKEDGCNIPQNLSLGANIVATWVGDKKYTDTSAQPRILPYQKTSGKSDPSFVSLVESVSRDIRPRAILDEFLRLGTVSYDEKTKSVTLQTKAFLPKKNWEEQVYYFGQNSGDHIAAAAHNVMGLKPAFFERSVYYDNLSEGSIEKLRKISSDSAMKLLEKINKKAYELSEKDKGKKNTGWRFNFGSYFFSEDEGTD